jgi:CRP-like cAMP-binding protein
MMNGIPMTNENSQILARVGLLAGLKNSPEALIFLASIMKPKSYEAGHELIKEGELGDEFFVLIEGQVSIYKNTPEGDIYKVAILKSDVTPALGEGGLIDAEPRSATVKCDVASKFLVLTRHDFSKFSDTQPQWAVPILQRLSLNLMSNLRKTSNDLMLLHKALMSEIRG